MFFKPTYLQKSGLVRMCIISLPILLVASVFAESQPTYSAIGLEWVSSLPYSVDYAAAEKRCNEKINGKSGWHIPAASEVSRMYDVKNEFAKVIDPNNKGVWTSNTSDSYLGMRWKASLNGEGYQHYEKTSMSAANSTCVRATYRGSRYVVGEVYITGISTENNYNREVDVYLDPIQVTVDFDTYAASKSSISPSSNVSDEIKAIIAFIQPHLSKLKLKDVRNYSFTLIDETPEKIPFDEKEANKYVEKRKLAPNYSYRESLEIHGFWLNEKYAKNNDKKGGLGVLKKANPSKVKTLILQSKPY